MALVTCELCWLKYLLHDVGVNITKSMKLYSDSKTAIHIGTNLIFYERSEYIEINCHFVKEKIVISYLHKTYS